MFTNSKIIIIALVSICNVWTAASTKYPAVPLQPNVAALFFKTQLAQLDPQQTCFDQYMQNTNKTNEQFSTNYNQCLLDAKSQHEALNVEMNEMQTNIATQSQVVCHRLMACNELSSPLDTFECHLQEGTVISRDVDTIRDDASNSVKVIQERNYLIEQQRDSCIQEAKRILETEMTINYNQLQQCLDGIKVAKVAKIAKN